MYARVGRRYQNRGEVLSGYVCFGAFNSQHRLSKIALLKVHPLINCKNNNIMQTCFIYYSIYFKPSSKKQQLLFIIVDLTWTHILLINDLKSSGKKSGLMWMFSNLIQDHFKVILLRFCSFQMSIVIHLLMEMKKQPHPQKIICRPRVSPASPVEKH